MIWFKAEFITATVLTIKLVDPIDLLFDHLRNCILIKYSGDLEGYQLTLADEVGQWAHAAVDDQLDCHWLVWCPRTILTKH